MTFNPDDPKYTAYVLDELSDTQRAEIEAEMLTNPAASALVREIRAATNELSAAFKTERLPELTAEQREAVLAGQIAPSPSPEGEGLYAASKPQPTRRPMLAAAIAASLLLALSAGWLLRGLNLQNDRETAALRGSKAAVATEGRDVSSMSHESVVKTEIGAAIPEKELRKSLDLAIVPGNKRVDETTAALQPAANAIGPVQIDFLEGFDVTVVKGNPADGRNSKERPLIIEHLPGPPQLPGQSQPQNGLNKSGAGTLTLSGANSDIGGTNVNAGTLNMTGGTLGSNSSSDGSQRGAIVRGYNVGGGGGNAGQTNEIVGADQVPGFNNQPLGNSASTRSRYRTPVERLPEVAPPPSFGGNINPSELIGLDPTGQVTTQRDIQFRQGGFGSLSSSTGGTTASQPGGPPPAPKPTAFQDDARNVMLFGLNPYAAESAQSSDEKSGWNKKGESLNDLQTRLAQVRTAIEFEKKASGEQDPNVRRLQEVALNLDSRLKKSVIELQERARIEQQHNTEAYDAVQDNPFLHAVENPLSTFSIDVDTASYSNIRRFLTQNNQLPPPGAVRIEELVNYFRYDYPQPKDDKPFSVTTEVASCPWAADHRLVCIGLKGREIDADKRPLTNLVFLIDVSGSMQPANKLPLVRESLKMLTEKLGENDTVAIVVYAGSSGLVLPSTRGDKRGEIIDAINRLSAGGSTNGAQGIELAYEIASQNMVKGGVNRVILATDGDFNVGVTSQDQLVKLIEEKAKTGVFLTTLGFGYGNIKDSTLEKLADKGNGNYAYIDDLREGHKVLVEQMSGTLVTIAKDVKIQVEFNPLEVAGYRLIGYENRMLAKEDFNNDKKDAGEIGAGHTVTALYEIVPVKTPAARMADAGTNPEDAVIKENSSAAVDPLRYIQPAALTEAAKQGELFTLKLRYKQPDGDKSTLMETPVKDSGKKYGAASRDFQFASAVASFGLILRNSPYKGNATLSAVEELAKAGIDSDSKTSDTAYRLEFVELAKKAKLLKGP